MFAKKHKEILRYLPDECDWWRLPRQWIIDVIHSVVEKPFEEFVKEQIKIRDKEMAESNDIMLKLRPELIEILKKTTAVTT